MVVRNLRQYNQEQSMLVERILKKTGKDISKDSKEIMENALRNLSEEDVKKLGKRVYDKLHITCLPDDVDKILKSEHLCLVLELKVGAKDYDSGEERYVGEEKVNYCLSSKNVSDCEHREKVEGAIPICSLEGLISNSLPTVLMPENIDRKVLPEIDVYKYYMSKQKGKDIGFIGGVAGYFGEGYGKDFLRRHVDLNSAKQIVKNAFSECSHASVLFSFESYLIDRSSNKKVEIDAFDFNCCVNIDYEHCKFRKNYDNGGLPECNRRGNDLDISIGHLDSKEIEAD